MMDLRSGDIREIPEGQKPKETEIELENLPNKNCKHCLGRGYEVKIIRIKVPCDCTGADKTSKEYFNKQVKEFLRQL